MSRLIPRLLPALLIGLSACAERPSPAGETRTVLGPDGAQVEVPAAGPDIFDDAQINKRSMQVFITYCPPPPAAKTERKRIRVVTFARQAKKNVPYTTVRTPKSR